jgi:hypothetical protein
MSDTQEIEQAVKRLNDALDGLDAVMELRLEADRRRGMLAEELDEVQAHTRALETTNREAARRLDEAMNVIRGIIEANQR